MTWNEQIMTTLYSDPHPKMEALQIQLLRPANRGYISNWQSFLGEELARQECGEIDE
jgi:hypothetical protein